MDDFESALRRVLCACDEIAAAADEGLGARGAGEAPAERIAKMRDWTDRLSAIRDEIGREAWPEGC